MKRFRSSLILAFLASAALLVACGDTGGGNNGGGSSGFSSSVDGSAELSGLSADDQQTLCDDVADYSASQISEDDACTFSGLFAAAFSDPQTDEELQQACSMAYDECINSEDDGGGDDQCEVSMTECTATVAEYETCAEARVQQTSDLLGGLPRCSEATLADLEDDGSGNQNELPQECQVIEDKCPGFFDDNQQQ